MDKLHFRNAERADLPALVAMMADDVLGAAREDASLPLDPGYAAAFEAIQSQANQRRQISPFGVAEMQLVHGRAID